MGPPKIRGLLVSLKEAAIVLGMLLGYSVGYYNSSIPGGWVYTYGTSAFFSLTMLAFSYTIPRSSRWLLKHGLEEEALQSLRFVFIGDDADRDFSSMRELHQVAMNAANVLSGNVEGEEQPSSILQTLRLLWKVPSYRAPLVTGVGLVVLQQITGQPSVLSYAAPIFAQAGLSSASSILVAAFKLAATLVAAFTVWLLHSLIRKTPRWWKRSFLFPCLFTLEAIKVGLVLRVHRLTFHTTPEYSTICLPRV
jgi:Sugar (and other) transporter